MPSKDDFRRMHDEENAEFSAYLHTLAPADWERPSLCDGWRVRDVVGHILYGNGLNLATLPLKLAKYGFSSDKSGKAYSIAQAEGQPVDTLLQNFDNRDAWGGTAKVFPPKLTLLDRLVHHQDIRRALGHQREIPSERLIAVLNATPRLGSVFGARKRTKELRFVATDVDWSWGSGPEVSGPGEALLMAMLGRRDALKDLDGPGLATLSAR